MKSYYRQQRHYAADGPGGSDWTGTAEGHSATETVREGAAQVRARAQEAADRAKGSIKEKVSRAAGQARARGEEAFQGKKEAAASRVEGYGEAVHDMADRLREEKDPNIAAALDRAAEQFDRISGYLWRRDVEGLIRDAQGLARRNPEILFGGLFLVGLAFSRFLKASTPPSADVESDDESYAGYEEPYGEYDAPITPLETGFGPAPEMKGDEL